jgi:hypothetical protein
MGKYRNRWKGGNDGKRYVDGRVIYQPYKDGGSVKETGKIESVEGIFMCAKTFFVVVSPTVNQTRDHVFRFSRCVVYVCVCAQMSYGKGKKKGKVVTE